MMLACCKWLPGRCCLVAKAFRVVFSIFLGCMLGCYGKAAHSDVVLLFACSNPMCVLDLTRVMFTLYTLQVSGVLTHLVIWLWFQAVCCERSLP